MKIWNEQEQDHPSALVHVDGCRCTGCAPETIPDDPIKRLMPTNPDIAEGMTDPRLALNYDSRFSSILGTGVNRRDLLKMGTLAALGSLFPTAATFAQEKKFDPVVKIGYLPITDAGALLVAHEMGFFKKEGLDSAPPTLDPRLVAAGRGLLRRTASTWRTC